MLLTRRGYNVIEAADGLEGLVKANWNYPDLILMDGFTGNGWCEATEEFTQRQIGGHTDHRSECVSERSGRTRRVSCRMCGNVPEAI